jgi:type I restriction enzyme S subunit
MNSSGTTFGSITREDLFNLPIILPTNEVISAFEVINTQIFEKQMVNYDLTNG